MKRLLNRKTRKYLFYILVSAFLLLFAFNFYNIHKGGDKVVIKDIAYIVPCKVSFIAENKTNSKVFVDLKVTLWGQPSDSYQGGLVGQQKITISILPKKQNKIIESLSCTDLGLIPDVQILSIKEM